MPTLSSGTPEPYDLKKILAPLETSKTQLTDFLQAQQDQYAKLEGIIGESSQKAYDAISSFHGEIAKFASQYDSVNPISVKNIDAETIVKPYREAVKEQITNLQNAYQSQVAVQAKQLDAAMGAGAFSGNSYRARQAYQNATNNLFNQTLGQIANVAITSEQNIMSTVADIASANLQANVSVASANLQAQTQRAGIQAQLLNAYGEVAKLTVEAGATLTSNWLGLANLNTNSVLSAIKLMADISFKEADIRQTLARDVFGSEMNALNNSVQLDIAYTQAAAQEIAAFYQYSAAQDQARAQEAVASINADAAKEIAQINADVQSQQNQYEYQFNVQQNQSALDYLTGGIKTTSLETGKATSLIVGGKQYAL